MEVLYVVLVAIFIFALLLLSMIASFLYPFVCDVAKAFVLQKFWVWFILPAFPRVPTFNFFQFFGVLIIIHLFCMNFSYEKEKDTSEREDGKFWKRILKKYGITVFFSVTVLGVGYVGHLIFSHYIG